LSGRRFAAREICTQSSNSITREDFSTAGIGRTSLQVGGVRSTAKGVSLDFSVALSRWATIATSWSSGKKTKRRQHDRVAAKPRVRAEVSRLDDGGRIAGVPQELRLQQHARGSAERRADAIAVQHGTSRAKLSK
jgi:hypothetical protein